ncbi:MAG: hypothetical protein C4293_20280 [Nitrospiraceae bacterium]
MLSALKQDHIESAINALPIQGRIMLRLLLLQYLDVTQEEIEYMASDRPDPRLQAGMKPSNWIISREAIQGIADRIAQYRSQIRQKRERLWLQGECLRKQIARREALCSIAEQLLSSRFGLSPEAVQELKKQGRNAVPKPMLRELDMRWDRNEITEDEYRGRRLAIEYQTLIRRLDRERKRLEVAKRELEAVSRAPLQDHEIGHIWGIPASAIAARKIKYLQQYLQGVQAKVQESLSGTQQATAQQLDLWKETFAILSQRPVERSVAAYDGLERTEAALLEKLTTLASGTLPEDLESRFWPAMSRSLFALQRLSAIQGEMDLSPEALEQDLLALISPTPKVTADSLEEPKPSEIELSEMGQHVLRSMMGEER